MDYNLMDALEMLEREKGVPRDIILEALANALLTMREPDQRARLGAEGKHLWESEFEPGQIGKAWNDLLGKLCAPAR